MSLYRQRPRIVEAHRVHEWTIIRAPHGTDYARPGDYVVTTKSGEQHAYKAELFEATFEEAPACSPLRASAEPPSQAPARTVGESGLAQAS